MTKKLSKQELKFTRNVKNSIENDSREKQPMYSKFYNSNPIFIPKRKKKK